MARCPNISHPDWKALKAKYGLKYTLYLYDQNGEDIPTLDEAEKLIKNKRSNDPLFNEALLSTDNELSNHIMNTIMANYDGIKMFLSREEFLKFVEKNGGDMSKVDLDAVGQAFKDAIFIDPERAVQSTAIHEVAHIYWDALPDDNSVKKQLRDLFSEHGTTQSEIDEVIIRNIGIAGVNIAEIELRGSKAEKFIALLKQFWANVKKVLGTASKKDLADLIARDILNNKEKFSHTQFVNGMVQNMKSNPFNIEYDEFTHKFELNGERMMSPTRAINMFSIFNPDEAANSKFEKLISSRLKNNDIEEDPKTKKERKKKKGKTQSDNRISNIELRERYIRMTKNRWEYQAEVGTASHAIAQGIIEGKTFDEIKQFIVNRKNATKVSDIFNNEMLDQAYKEISKFLTNMTNKGWKLKSEVVVGSKQFNMAGLVDLIMEKDGKIVVVDFKSYFQEDKSEKKTGRYLKFPLENLSDTKENKNKLQINMYGNMIEEQEGKDVSQVIIVPMLYDTQGRTITKFSVEAPKVYRRKSRKGIKDSNRNNARIVMAHAKKIQQIKNDNMKSFEEIEKLAKERGIDADFLQEEQEAMMLLSNYFGRELTDIPHQYIERLLNTGMEVMVSSLIDSLGYKYEDIFGSDEEGQMTAKEFILRFIHRIKPDEKLQEVDLDDVKDFEAKILNKFGEQSIYAYGATDIQGAYSVYKKERKLLDEIFEEIGSVEGLQTMKENKLDEIYRQVINLASPEGKKFKQFIEDMKISRLIADNISRENMPGYRGVKQSTIFISRLIKSPDSLFTTFDRPGTKKWQKATERLIRRFFQNLKKIDKAHILIQILSLELANEHRNSVRRTEAIRNTLNKYHDDTENLDGSKKAISKRQSLSNDDFEDITYTDNKTKLVYYETPSEAREILEKKYGEDDPRPRNMARYISALTDELIQHNDRLREINLKRQPRILIPELQATKGEIFSELNGLNKMHYGKVANLFGYTAYDNTVVSYRGEKKKFVEFKQDFHDEIKLLDDDGKSISKKLNEFKDLKTRIQNSVKDHPEMKSRTIGVIGRQTGRTVLKSKQHNASIHEHISSIIEAGMMERVIPIAEFTKKQYADRQIDETASFLDNEINKKMYKDVEDMTKGTLIGDAIMASIKWTAITYLGFSIDTNIRNRMYGFAFNWAMHPRTMARSYKRTVTNFGDTINPIKMYRKLAGIMEYNNIGTVLQDVEFSKYKKRLDQLNSLAFKPLEFTEYWNQGELLKGLIEEEEYNAYNDKGKPYIVFEDDILDPDENTTGWSDKKKIEHKRKLAKGKPHPRAISNERANEFSNILSEVHGYFGFNKSPWSYNTLGKFIGMFTLSWAQSVASFLYAPKETDSVGRTRTGIMNSFGLATQMFAFSFFHTADGRKNVRDKLVRKYIEGSAFKTRREAEDKLYELDRFADPRDGGYIQEIEVDGKKMYFIPGLNVGANEFEELVLGNEDANRFTLKGDVPFVDSRNLVRLLVMGANWAVTWWIKDLFDDKDKDIMYDGTFKIGEDGKEILGRRKDFAELTSSEMFKHYLYRFIAGNFEMVNDDFTFLVNPEFYDNFIKYPPAWRTVKKLGETITNLILYARSDPRGYNMKPTLKREYLTPKYIDNLISLTPYFFKPFMHYKTIKRALNDDVYWESVSQRADNSLESYRNKIISKERGIYYSKGMSEKEIDKAITPRKKYFDDNAKIFKEMFTDIETLYDIKTSVYYKHPEFAEYMSYVQATKTKEEEETIARRKKVKVKREDLSRRKKELEKNIKQ